ncbi:MAG: tetratricopeptide repeat protein [Gammaproteobacteria bacterium]|nr:tetratricopeptide repeat protein [Gammaproteobacteria bacterium]
MAKHIYQSGELTVDLSARQVTLAGEPLELPKLSFLFLKALIERAGECIEFDELIVQVWQGKVVSDDTLAQRASLLRKALASDSNTSDITYFETVRGVGFRWVMPVTEVTVKEIPVNEVPVNEVPVKKVTDDENVIPLQHPPAKPIEDSDTIQYSFETRDSLDYESNRLSKRTLFDREKIFQHRKKLIAVPTFLLFLPALFIAFNFFNKESPERPPSNSGEVTQADPADMLRLTLDRANKYAREFNAQSNKLAIDLYLKALRMDKSNVEAIRGLSLSLLHKVSKFDGTESQLHLAERYTQTLLLMNDQDAHNLWLRGFYFDVVGNINKAIELYEQALAKNFRSNEIKGALAYLYAQKGRLHEAMHLNIDTLGSQQEFQLLQIAESLSLAGLNNDALQWYQRALELAPNNSLVSVGFARHYLAQQQYDAAVELLNTLHEANLGSVDSQTLLAEIYLQQHDLANAKQHLEIASQQATDSLYVNAWKEWVDYIEQGEQHIQKDVPKLNKADWPNLWLAGAVYAMAQSKPEIALDYLDNAEQLGYINYLYLQHSVAFELLRDEEMFQEIIQRMKQRANAEAAKIKSSALPKLP